MFTLLRSTTNELFFSCCESVAAHFKQSAIVSLGASQLLKPAMATFNHRFFIVRLS
jgi:hypothetical protein